MGVDRSEIFAEFGDLLGGFIFETDAGFVIIRSAGIFPHGGATSVEAVTGSSLLEVTQNIADLPARHALVRSLQCHEKVSRLRYHVSAGHVDAGEGVACFEISVQPIIEDGAFAGCRGIIIDVTSAEEAENAVRAERQAAEIASQARTEFLASISHELRTPLNAIIGFSEIIQAEVLGPLGDDRYGEYAGDILNSGQHLLGLINEMLDISRLETGKVALREDDVHLDKLITSCMDGMAEQFAEKRVDVSVTVPPVMPVLWGDGHAIRQMLAHLFSNAHKFVEHDGRVDVAIELPDDGTLRLRIADTGVGIAADQLDYVLIPFVQGDHTVSRRHSGTGLGLPITKALMDLHGGRLEIASRLGEGTQITMVFPAERVVDYTTTSTLKAG